MSEYTRVALTKDRLAEAMQRAEKTQADLVRATGLNRGTISRYLSGAVEPRHEAAHKLAKALNVTEMWLLGYDTPMTRTQEQKKNDVLSELVVRLRSDEKLFGLVVKLTAVDEAQLDLIDKLVSGLK